MPFKYVQLGQVTPGFEVKTVLPKEAEKIPIDIALQNAITRAPLASSKAELDKIDDEIWEASGRNALVLKESLYWTEYKKTMNKRLQELLPDPAFDAKWINELSKKASDWFVRIEDAAKAQNLDMLSKIYYEIIKYETHDFPVLTTSQGMLRADDTFGSLYNRLVNYMGFEEYREGVKKLAEEEGKGGFAQWFANLLGINITHFKYATILVGSGLLLLLGLKVAKAALEIVPRKKATLELIPEEKRK